MVRSPCSNAALDRRAIRSLVLRMTGMHPPWRAWPTLLGRARPAAGPRATEAGTVRYLAPTPHATPERSDHEFCVGLECIHRGARRPPSLVVQGPRKVPVIQSQERFDTVFQQEVHEPVVKVETLAIYGASSFGEHTGPR